MPEKGTVLKNGLIQYLCLTRKTLIYNEPIRPPHSKRRRRYSNLCPATSGALSGSQGGVPKASTPSWSSTTGASCGTTCTRTQTTQTLLPTWPWNGNKALVTKERQKTLDHLPRQSQPVLETSSPRGRARRQSTTLTKIHLKRSVACTARTSTCLGGTISTRGGRGWTRA